jgi:hypothetical protein
MAVRLFVIVLDASVFPACNQLKILVGRKNIASWMEVPALAVIAEYCIKQKCNICHSAWLQHSLNFQSRFFERHRLQNPPRINRIEKIILEIKLLS